MRAWIRHLAVLSCAVAFSPATPYAVDLSGWTTHGSTSAVRAVVAIDDTVWALTGGGAVVVDAGVVTRIVTNADGLLTNDLMAGVVDDSARLWIAGVGWLIRRDRGADIFTPYVVLDQSGDPITLRCLADDGDRLWVGSDLGVSLFVKSRGEIKDTYTRFGALPSVIAVNDAHLFRDSLWLATPFGLAVGDLSDPLQLKSYANWTSFTSGDYPELPSPVISAVQHYRDTLYVGTSDGVYALHRSAIDTTFARLNMAAGAIVNALRVDADGLRIYTSRGEFRYDGSLVALPSTGLPTTNTSDGVTIGGERIVGLAKGGAFRATGVGAFARIETGAPPGDAARDIYTLPGGRALGAFGADSFAVYDGATWGVLPFAVRGGAISVSGDDAGAFWLGTFGMGVWRVDGAGAVRYDSVNSSLQGNSDGGRNNFVVIPEIVAGDGYVYFANFRAVDGFPLGVADAADPARWTSLGVYQGINDVFATSVDYFGGAVAVSSERAGVYLCRVGANPFDTASVTVTHFHTRADTVRLRLPTDDVNVVRFGRDGVLWVAHIFGLARYDAGIERFVDMSLPITLGPEVTDVTFDRQGGVWVATPNGLGWLDPSINDFRVFTALNSGLISSHVNALSFDDSRNVIWIATDRGVSIYAPGIGAPTFSAEDVTAYPNPFVTSGSGELLRFNYSGVAGVDIFSETGESIWSGSSTAGWRGVNQSGNDVASGVYLFVLRGMEGAVGRGKILLIRDQ